MPSKPRLQAPKLPSFGKLQERMQKIPLSPTLKRFALPLVIVSALLLIGVSVFAYLQPKRGDAATRELVAKVSKLMNLPDEEPKVATVSDQNKLDPHPLFAAAQNGDRVLYFSDAELAVVYRPSSHKIIATAPIQFRTVDPQAANQNNQTSGGELPPPTVSILNGTSQSGLASRTQDQIEKADVEVEFGRVGNANRNTYEQSVVIAVNPAYSALAQELASLLNASVEELPSNESESDADILVIVGAPTPSPANSPSAEPEPNPEPEASPDAPAENSETPAE